MPQVDQGQQQESNPQSNQQDSGEGATPQSAEKATPAGDKSPSPPPAFDLDKLADGITAKVIQKLSAAETQKKETSKKQEKEKGSIDWDEIYTDPEKVFLQFGEQLVARVTSDITSKYQQATAQSNFWASFYSQNPQLKSAGPMVQAVLAANEEKWVREGISEAEAQKRLREETIGMAKKLLEEPKKKDDDIGGGSGFVMDGLKFIREPEKRPEQNEMKKFSDVLREKQAARYRGEKAA